MRCPQCGAAVRIKTTVVIRHYPDDRWEVETPFQFQPDDPVECSCCNWSCIYGKLQPR